MKRHSLNFIMTLSVLMINIVSGCLTLLLIYFLHHWKIFAFLRLPQATLISSIVIGTVLSAIVYHRFLRPIERLIRATKKVKAGDFTVRTDPAHAVGAMSDLIESFNDMTEGLSSVEMLKSDFINTFSHEFKTPIVSIRGFAKQLQRQDLSEEQRKEYLDIIIRQSDRLAKMSTNVLLLSRYENEQTVKEQKNVAIDETIRECILLLRKDWEAKSIEWNLSLSPICLRSDPAMLEQLFLNLLSNAVKFSNPCGTVSVSCTESEGNISISIRDEGEGIDETSKARIFEKFYQSDTSRAREGNGLGLSIVKRIVELSKGTIRVISEEGKGCEFIVTLPQTSTATSTPA